MKNRNLFISTVSAISGAAITLPLALTTASCSCSRNKFAGDNVLDEVYEPTIGQLGGTDPILLSEGTEEWWDYLKNHRNMPQEEYRWTSSCMASLGKQLIEGFPKERFNITQWTGRLSNFKINNESKKRVSYVATQQIGLDVNLRDQKGLSLFGESPVQSIKGHVGLSWRYEVKNTPIGCFDFDPSNLIGGQIYKSETVWYIAPDLSSIESGDDSWSINYDFLPDIDVTINDQEIIKLNNELQFSFDKTLAGIIESGFSDADLPMAYFIERMIGLISGWNSYYLSQTKQEAHIDWENSSWQAGITPDADGYVTTGFGQAPIYDFKINDGSYSKDDIYTANIGLYIDPSDPEWELSLNDIKINPAYTHSEIVDYTDQKLSVAYDFCDADEFGSKRFENGSSYESLSATGVLPYNVVLPVIITKDWISIGGLSWPSNSQTNEETPEPILLKEVSANDQYVQDVVNKQREFDATKTEPYKATISFPISDTLYNDWFAHKNKYAVILHDQGDEGYPVALQSDPTLGGTAGNYKVSIDVRFNVSEAPASGILSNTFDVWFVDYSPVANGARIAFDSFHLKAA